jgi:hypothetical protein
MCAPGRLGQRAGEGVRAPGGGMTSEQQWASPEVRADQASGQQAPATRVGRGQSPDAPADSQQPYDDQRAAGS